MSTRNLVLAALMIAITAALGMIKLSFPFFNEVPITGQTLGIMLAGALLGARLGGISIAAFVALVAVGVPLLSGGRGGPGVFASASGGWILSWPLAAFVIGYMVEKSIHSLRTWKVFLFNIVGGIIVIYIIGMGYQAALTGVPFFTVAIKSLLFVPGDLLKSFVAAVIAVRVHQAYPLLQGSLAAQSQQHNVS
ncbi:MAG: biotin transporter BioY [Clostridia bacterium]